MVISVRHGQDAGMVDVFNCDRLAPEECRPLLELFTRDDLLRVFSGEGVVPRNPNVYLNSGVSRTQGLHLDWYSGKLKAFVYLAALKEVAAGPYCYVNAPSWLVHFDARTDSSRPTSSRARRRRSSIRSHSDP